MLATETLAKHYPFCLAYESATGPVLKKTKDVENLQSVTRFITAEEAADEGLEKILIEDERRSAAFQALNSESPTLIIENAEMIRKYCGAGSLRVCARVEYQRLTRIINQRTELRDQLLKAVPEIIECMP